MSTPYKRIKDVLKTAPCVTRAITEEEALVFMHAYRVWLDSAQECLNELPERDPVDVWAERNYTLHAALRAAVQDKEGWRDRAESALSGPPNLDPRNYTAPPEENYDA